MPTCCWLALMIYRSGPPSKAKSFRGFMPRTVVVDIRLQPGQKLLIAYLCRLSQTRGQWQRTSRQKVHFCSAVSGSKDRVMCIGHWPWPGRPASISGSNVISNYGRPSHFALIRFHARRLDDLASVFVSRSLESCQSSKEVTTALNCFA